MGQRIKRERMFSRWARERWPAIRDNAVYDIVKTGSLGFLGLVVYWFMKYMVPAISTLAPAEAKIIATITSLLTVSSVAITWLVVTRSKLRLQHISNPANVQQLDAAAHSARQQRPNLTFVASRLTDAWLSNDSSRLGWSQGQYDRHVGAIVLVFHNEPLSGSAGKISSTRASITFTNDKTNEVIRVPAAVWVGFYDTCGFGVGDSRELLLVLKLGKGYKFPYAAAEARRSASGYLPPHYPTVATGSYGVKVRLFDADGGGAWDFAFSLALDDSGWSVYSVPAG